MKVIARSLLAVSFSVLLTAPAATAVDTDYLSRLSTLEKRFLNRSYPKEPEAKRVERLESFVFGEASEGDLTERLERLVDTVPELKSSSTNTSAPQPAPSYSNVQPDSSSQSNQSDTTTSDSNLDDPYPKIGAMEKVLLGSTDTNGSLDTRLSRLEEKAFGKTKAELAYSDRTDALQGYIEKKTHKKLFVPPPTSAQADTSGDAQYSEEQPKRSKLPGIINALSTAVFGPVMNPMYGPAMGNVGFGGVRVRHRDDVPQQENEVNEEPVKKPENPLVYKKSPPPASANMLTKVAWLEVQLFGHTMSSMHLPKRLENINGELEFKPGKSGINLMDDVDTMTNLVARKHLQNQAIGTKAKTQVQ